MRVEKRRRDGLSISFLLMITCDPPVLTRGTEEDDDDDKRL